jgi:hypothetical protein
VYCSASCKRKFLRAANPTGYRAYLKARLEERASAKADNRCRVCKTSIAGKRVDAEYCGEACEKRAYYDRVDRERRGSVRRAPRSSFFVRLARSSSEPIPALATGHPLFDAARAALKPYERNELGSDMDSVAADLCSVYALAALEGRDPLLAMEAERRRWGHMRATTVFGYYGVDPR